MPSEVQFPEKIKKRIEAGEAAIAGQMPYWQMPLAFFSNDQYVHVAASTNRLDRLETREGGSKPRYRARFTRNRFTSAVISEASVLVSRIPSYGVTAPNQDKAALDQARLGERVLTSLHWLLKLRATARDVIIYAILTGQGFSWPYWDARVGQLVDPDDDGKMLREGEVGMGVFHNGEMLWEPGSRFDESDWWCIRKARPVSQIKEYASKNKERVKKDASWGSWERPGNDGGDLAFQYTYIERPRGSQKGGQWTFVKWAMTQDPGPYPRKNGRDCIHQLSWISRPHGHRDLGAGEQLIDCQRTYNRTVNRIISWMAHVLNPQMIAPKGSVIGEVTDEDGAVFEYRPVSGQKPEWKHTPETPQSLFQALDQCIGDMDEILGQRELPTNLDSGSGIVEKNKYDASRRQLFISQLVDWYSEQGLHILEIVQERYSEERLLPLQGRFGIEMISDFKGRQLGDIGTVTVTEASVNPRNPEQERAQIMVFADKGWIPPHQAMHAIQAGFSEAIIDSFQLDMDKQYREIEKFMAFDIEPADVRGQEMAEISGLSEGMAFEVEGMPVAEEMDNHVVHEDVLTQWMKTADFEKQNPLTRRFAEQHLRQHQALKQMEEDREAQQQAIRAQSLGAANASADQQPGTPSTLGAGGAEQALNGAQGQG